MLRFVVRRLLSLIPTLFLIVTLSFFIIRIAPGGPFSSEKSVPPEVLQNIMRTYHMDESLPKQYLRYLSDVAKGDLGDRKSVV